MNRQTNLNLFIWSIFLHLIRMLTFRSVFVAGGLESINCCHPEFHKRKRLKLLVMLIFGIEAKYFLSLGATTKCFLLKSESPTCILAVLGPCLCLMQRSQTFEVTRSSRSTFAVGPGAFHFTPILSSNGGAMTFYFQETHLAEGPQTDKTLLQGSGPFIKYDFFPFLTLRLSFYLLSVFWFGCVWVEFSDCWHRASISQASEICAGAS